jgi:NADPH:quinone reductase-like Zn-dependent oxidoreductase
VDAVQVGGQINFVGRLSSAVSAIDTNVLYNAAATIRVIFAGNRDQFVAMNRAFTANRLKPLIDRVFSFADVPAAFRYFENGGHFGKVVITHD